MFKDEKLYTEQFQIINPNSSIISLTIVDVFREPIIDLEKLPLKTKFVGIVIGKHIKVDEDITYLIRYTTNGSAQDGIFFNIDGSRWGIILMDSGMVKPRLNMQNSGSTQRSEMKRIFLGGIETQDQLISILEAQNDKRDSKLIVEETDKWVELARSFSMRPPTNLNSSSTLPTKNIENPFEFLDNKYFSMLYSISTPLSYFPKTAFSRLKILCNQDKSCIMSSLRKMILNLKQFDERHIRKLGILRKVNGEVSKNHLMSSEYKYKEEFILRNPLIHNVNNATEQALVSPESAAGEVEDNPASSFKTEAEISKEERLDQLVMGLKVREACLQIILILELVSQMNVDPNEFSLSKKVAKINDLSQNNKVSLVRRRMVKRKVKPTFLGVGVEVKSETIELKTKNEFDNNELLLILTALLDRLSIWDMLLGKTTKSDGGSMSFLAYVLIPYFSKKIPVIVNSIIEKIKGSSLKISKIRVRSKSKSESGSAEPEAKPLPEPESTFFNSTFQKPGTAKLTRSKSIGTNVPLSTKQNSQLGDKIPSIRRTSSTLSVSTKSLQKRQVDMTVPVIDKSSLSSHHNTNKNSNKASQQDDTSTALFGGIRRTKSVTGKMQQNSFKSQSVSQVDATPMNNRTKTLPNVEISETPADGNRSLSQILSAESKTNGISITDSFTNTLIDSSPTSMSPSLRVMTAMEIVTSPYIEGKNNLEIFSSPVSGTKTKSKPGEPVSVSDSPFYSATFSGSPSSVKRKKAGPTYGSKSKKRLFTSK